MLGGLEEAAKDSLGWTGVSQGWGPDFPGSCPSSKELPREVLLVKRGLPSVHPGPAYPASSPEVLA